MLACILRVNAIEYAGEMYVRAGNENAAEPYNSSETAAADIQTALAIATDGATVHVADGEYTLSNRLELTQAIRLVGNDANPSNVVLTNTKHVHWDDKRHRCLTLNHAEACVSGITFKDGKDYDNGGNIYIGENGGVVTNCIMRNGFTREGYDSAGANIAIEGPGLVTHCWVYGGYMNNCSGGNRVSSVYLNGVGARIENSLIEGFDGANVESQATTQGAGLFVAKGAAVNCTVVNCTSKYTTDTGFSGIRVERNGWATNCVSALNVDSNGVLRAFSTTNASHLVHCACDTLVGVAVNGEEMVQPVIGVATNFFMDAANGNYMPKTKGPLVGAGLNYEGAAAFDLAGNARVVGRKIDLGCYECPYVSFILKLQ